MHFSAFLKAEDLESKYSADFFQHGVMSCQNEMKQSVGL